MVQMGFIYPVIVPTRWSSRMVPVQKENCAVKICVDLTHGTCSSWVQFDSSGCTNSWAEMRGGTCVFTGKGCREVAMLVGEVEDIRQMMETMRRIVTGLGLEEVGGQTGDRVARREEEKGEGLLTPDRSADTSEEDRDTDIEIEGEHGTEGDTSRRRMAVKICSGAPILATNSYTRNPDSPLGNEIDLQQGDVLSYTMAHEDNEHWWLAEDIAKERWGACQCRF